jgi:hypothetical protein
MAALTQHRGPGGFIISEGEWKHSRATGVIASGQDLEAGALIMDDGSGKLVAWDGDVESACAGVLLSRTDARNGDRSAAYVKGAAEVNAVLLDHDGTEEDAAAVLAAIGIVTHVPVSAGSGGDGDVPAPPSGFQYLVNADAKYIVNNTGAYILAKV